MKPCRRCGATERYKNGQCKPCQRQRSKKYYHDNIEEARENLRRWKEENPEKQRAYVRKSQETHSRKKESQEIEQKNFEIQKATYQQWKKNMKILKKRQKHNK